MDGVDYKALLEKYITHVGQIEGATYVYSAWGSDVEFTPEEWEALQAAEMDGRRRYGRD